MNITYFIGNGFDVNLGYKTKYSDFYGYYTKEYPDDLLAKEIDKDKENWADLEWSLGQFLKERYKGNILDFIQSKNRLDNALSVYLEKEAGRNIVFTGDAAQEFQNRIVHVEQFLSANDAIEYQNATGSVSDTVHYCFISFNYTNSLDRIIGYSRGNAKPFAVHRGGSSNYTDDISDPIHIHGKVTEEMILGVNDASQMSKGNEVSDELTLAMIKPEINDSLGNRNNATVQSVINDSKYIFVYGMSLGLTDLRWWKSILEWLKKDQSRRLVVFYYTQDGRVPSGGETAQRKNRIRKRYFATVGAIQEEYDKYKQQVIVQINSEVFDFKKIKLEAPKKL